MTDRRHGWRLDALESLLAIGAVELRPALTEAADAIAAATGAEKVDVFLLDEASASLVALGVSNTPLGAKQRSLGLDRLPLVNGGRSAHAFGTGAEFMTGNAESDPEELRAIVHGLGVRSSVVAPFDVGGVRRGVVGICSTKEDAFPDDALAFARTVARWVGLIAHRAEVVDSLTAAAKDLGRRRAAEELVTVVAHDLRNYLSPILGRVALIRQRAARDHLPAYERDAASAERSVGRLSRLVSDLLDVARIEQGLFEVQLAPVELVTLVREVAEEIQDATVPIVVRGEPEIVVDADVAKLRQVFENLIANASRHSPAGTPVEVKVTTGVGDGGRRVARVGIADRGPGMDARLASQVFQRFAHGPESGGLGLGLYLAREVVLAHGGTLQLYTAPDRGARFELELRAREP